MTTYRINTVNQGSALDVVGGRLEWISTTRIDWKWTTSNQIRLWNPNTSSWVIVSTASEPTLANTAYADLGTGAVSLAVDKIYDVFAQYSSSTAFTLVCSPWATATAGTSARTAAWVGNYEYKVGQRVSNSSHYYVCKTAHTSHATTFSNDSANWVDNGLVPSNADFTGLYQHDGVWVSGSDTTGKSRRWLGIIYTYNNSSTVNFKDAESTRLISNYYNPILKSARTYNSTSDWTFSSNSWREWNNGTGQVKGYFIMATSQDIFSTITQNIYVQTNGGHLVYGMAFDVTNDVSLPGQVFSGYGTLTFSMCIQGVLSINKGYHYITGVEKADGTNTVHPYGGSLSHGHILIRC